MRALQTLPVIDHTEHRVDGGEYRRDNESGLAACHELAALNAIDVHYRCDKPREGVGQSGEEEVGVQPYRVTSPATPKQKGRERVEQAADVGDRDQGHMSGFLFAECTGNDDEAQEEEPGEESGEARINNESPPAPQYPLLIKRCAFRRRGLWLRVRDLLELGVGVWTWSRINIAGGSNCAVLSLPGWLRFWLLLRQSCLRAGRGVLRQGWGFGSFGFV